MAAEIIGTLATIACLALIVFALIYWLKIGGFNKFIDSFDKSEEKQNSELRKELRAYKKALREAYTIIELKNLEIEELTQKQKEKNNEK